MLPQQRVILPLQLQEDAHLVPDRQLPPGGGATRSSRRALAWRPSGTGAHVCQEMGSSLQTHLLSYWVRAKQAFTLEEAVRELTFDNTSAWELNDRGLVRTGFKANLVLFDAQRVKPAMPTVETDPPGGARRLVQKAEGITATVVNGEVTLENGKATGRAPGRLLRGPGAGPGENARGTVGREPRVGHSAEYCGTVADPADDRQLTPRWL